MSEKDIYKAIKDFKDLQDDNRLYKAGDLFPRKGKSTKKRLDELLGDKNAVNEPVIELIESEPVKETKPAKKKAETKEDDK